MYKNEIEEFNSTAKFWTESYAKESSKDDAVKRLGEMGFGSEEARGALERCGWDESAAVNSLLGVM